MPTVERAGATIYYEEHGDASPIKPLEAFAGEFRIIAMDQRNAGSRSRGPLEPHDGWGMYARDQLAVLDAVGVDKTLVIGCCIGCSFIFKLIEVAPQRIAAGVLMQPIGHDSSNEGQFGPDMWRPWGQNLMDKGASFSMDDLDRFGHSLFDSGFVFTATRESLKDVQTPLQLLYGDDRAHPRGVSEEVASVLPNLEVIQQWKDESVAAEVTERMRAFLRAHQPQLAAAR
jgi:pimeloyl-ACP methyl ester carboxylesterase